MNLLVKISERYVMPGEIPVAAAHVERAVSVSEVSEDQIRTSTVHTLMDESQATRYTGWCSGLRRGVNDGELIRVPAEEAFLAPDIESGKVGRVVITTTAGEWIFPVEIVILGIAAAMHNSRQGELLRVPLVYGDANDPVAMYQVNLDVPGPDAMVFYERAQAFLNRDRVL